MVAVADRQMPRTRTLHALFPATRGGLAAALKRKIVGRLLLDGGTVEEPDRGARALDLPRPERRPVLRLRRRR
jgi:hypothetical protein